MAVCQTDRYRGLAVLVRSYRDVSERRIGRSCRRLRTALCQSINLV